MDKAMQAYVILIGLIILFVLVDQLIEHRNAVKTARRRAAREAHRRLLMQAKIDEKLAALKRKEQEARDCDTIDTAREYE